MIRAFGVCAGFFGFFTMSVFGQGLALQLVAENFNQPDFVTAPAGDARLFVVERGGKVKIVENGATLATPFLDLPNVSTQGERGLLGLAFDPNYATNGRIYVDYVDYTTLKTTIARYHVSSDRNVIDLSSGQVLLTVDQPVNFGNHKGGWIAFRPGEPNNLYIAMGDGGENSSMKNDPFNYAQNLNVNLGKILRLDVSGNTAGYAIPADNPFAGATPGNDEIWAYGVRNPYRDSFDRLTGDFYMADVGALTREEVDFVKAGTAGGLNFGWRPREGTAHTTDVTDPDPVGATDPIFEYLDANQPFARASITGGYVYRGTKLAGLQGTYVFGDYVNGTFMSFTYNGSAVSNALNLTSQLDPDGTLFGHNTLASFGEDGFGELYAVDLPGGQVFQFVPEPSSMLLLAGAGVFLAARRWR